MAHPTLVHSYPHTLQNQGDSGASEQLGSGSECALARFPYIYHQFPRGQEVDVQRHRQSQIWLNSLEDWVGERKVATGSLTEHRAWHVAGTKSRSVSSDTSLGLSAVSWRQIWFFIFNLAGGSTGFHTLWRLWEPDSPSPSTASSCQDCLGILDKNRTRFLLMPLWRVTCSGVESVGFASSESVSCPMSRFQATGRDKNVTMLKQHDHFLSLSPYSASRLPLLPAFYGVWLKWVIFFLFHACLCAHPRTRPEMTQRGSRISHHRSQGRSRGSLCQRGKALDR